MTCARCHRWTHTDACTARTFEDGTPIPCERCGRVTHTERQCSARTHADGVPFVHNDAATKFCTNCQRVSHFASDCRAIRDIDGASLFVEWQTPQ